MRGVTPEPTSWDQNKMQERGQGKGNERKGHKLEEIIGAQKKAARQSRAAPPARGRKEKLSTCAWTGDHRYHAQRTDDGGGRDAQNWTGARGFECVRSAGVRRYRSAGDPPQWAFSLQPGCLLGVLQRLVR